MKRQQDGSLLEKVAEHARLAALCRQCEFGRLVSDAQRVGSARHIVRTA
jgi:hypothetical protein